MQAQDVAVLPITLPHLYRLPPLERLSDDPFGRLIIAQALEEQLPVVTADKLFIRYEVDVLW